MMEADEKQTLPALPVLVPDTIVRVHTLDGLLHETPQPVRAFPKDVFRQIEAKGFMVQTGEKAVKWYPPGNSIVSVECELVEEPVVEKKTDQLTELSEKSIG